MPNIAILHDDVVVNVVACGDDWQAHFPDGVATTTAAIGDIYADGEFTTPERPVPPPTEADLIAYAAARRWLVETDGIVVDGIPVATDDRSKLLVLGAARLAYASASFTTPFKAADGSLHTLTAAQVIAISDAGSAHVQATFETFAAVAAQIGAGTLTTFAEIDAAAWPPNT